MNLNDVRDQAYGNACDKGFWDEPYTYDVSFVSVGENGIPTTLVTKETNPLAIATKLMKIVSETAEAMEENCKDYGWGLFLQEPEITRKEHMAEELADIIIRVADLAGHLDIDLDDAVANKMVVNMDRPHKHNKRY